MKGKVELKEVLTFDDVLLIPQNHKWHLGMYHLKLS